MQNSIDFNEQRSATLSLMKLRVKTSASWNQRSFLPFAYLKYVAERCKLCVSEKQKNKHKVLCKILLILTSKEVRLCR